MMIPDYFYLEGSKTLLFRREGNVYITFDPERLEFLKLNLIGAEIMYYVSVHMPMENMVKIFAEKYHIPKSTAEYDISMFIRGCSFTVYIEKLLEELGDYLEEE